MIRTNAPGITLAAVVCDGCVGAQGRECGHWGECDIRACAAEAGVSTCEACAQYPCTRLERCFSVVLAAGVVLDGLHA